MKNSLNLPNPSALVRHLLREELKSRKLSFTLGSIGVAEVLFIAQLNEPIAQILQLKTDEAFLEYDNLMDRHARRVNVDIQSIEKETEAVIVKLGLKKG